MSRSCMAVNIQMKYKGVIIQTAFCTLISIHCSSDMVQTILDVDTATFSEFTMLSKVQIQILISACAIKREKRKTAGKILDFNEMEGESTKSKLISTEDHHLYRYGWKEHSRHCPTDRKQIQMLAPKIPL